MDNWISDLMIFAAGIASGVLITSLKPLFLAARRRRTELVAARTRMIAGIKEKHEEEILDEAFRTTEAIRGELDKSLATLRKTLNATLVPGVDEPQTYHGTPAIQLSEPSKPH